jgi:hypothetical protein
LFKSRWSNRSRRWNISKTLAREVIILLYDYHQRNSFNS